MDLTTLIFLIFSGLTLIYVTVAVTPHEEEAH